MIDADLPKGRARLQKKLEGKQERPLIVLSLHDINDDRVLFVKKPIKTDEMLSALAHARQRISDAKFANVRSAPDFTKGTLDKDSDTHGKTDEKLTETEEETPHLKRYSADLSERSKTSKHQTAMLLDEKGFTALMSGLQSINIDNLEQVKVASYNPKDYFQGYVQSAYLIAGSRGQILQLNSGWKQLFIFPHSKEVWLDADDKQLRAFAGIVIKKSNTQKMSISALKPKAVTNQSLDKFQTMDGMLWKLSCWTSKGRFPIQFDIEHPVFLKHWPNFTRLMVTPHALRIAALLI
ncbi:MAG: hypothetical protein ACU84J_05260, partial [Gammaproteobacteria bacterium]